MLILPLLKNVILFLIIYSIYILQVKITFSKCIVNPVPRIIISITINNILNVTPAYKLIIFSYNIYDYSAYESFG